MSFSVSGFQFVFSLWQKKKTLSSWLVQQIKRKCFYSSDGSHSHSRVSFDLGPLRQTQSLAARAVATLFVFLLCSGLGSWVSEPVYVCFIPCVDQSRRASLEVIFDLNGNVLFLKILVNRKFLALILFFSLSKSSR